MHDPTEHIVFDGAILERAFSTKFLGVLIDDKLN